MPSKKTTVHTENHVMVHDHGHQYPRKMHRQSAQHKSVEIKHASPATANPSMQLHGLLRQVEHLKNEMNQETTSQQLAKFKDFNRSLEKQYEHTFLQYTAQKKAFKESIDAMMVQHKLFADKQHALQQLDLMMMKRSID